MINAFEKSISVHWLRVSRPESHRLDLRALLVSFFGVPEKIRGRWLYEFGERFSCGVLILWGSTTSDSEDGSPRHCCVDVPGGALDSLDPDQRFKLCQELAAGSRVTRLDLACDVRALRGSVGLIAHVRSACENGCLVGAKRWAPREEYNANERVAYGVTVGRRGNMGSGRYLRIYDKGLETGTGPEGQWERYEVEFSDDPASEVAASIFESFETFESRAFQRVAGAFDYCTPSTGTGRNYERRRLKWWGDFIGGIEPVASVAHRQRTTVDRYAAWLTRSVLPRVAYVAKVVGASYLDAISCLAGPDIRPTRDDKYTRVFTREFIERFVPWYEMGVPA